jgi:2,3-bisphosphoglycerate-dependent phosphoglycerate mutase
MTDSWPQSIWLVRHGESAGNVARDSAERDGLHTIAITGRDIDVPLSALGERQSRAFGRWIAEKPERRPSVVLSSPYARARRTAELIIADGGLSEQSVSYLVDERLREKEFGSFNRFTKLGITAKFPQEAERYAEVGKFYYRPPGGESWCDVILRLRSVLHHVQLRYATERVLIVAHQVIVLCFRYLLEELDEPSLLAIDRQGEVANCSLTSFERGVASDGRNKLLLEAYNFVAPLTQAGETVTSSVDPGTPKA